jgi:hypothetical protein
MFHCGVKIRQCCRSDVLVVIDVASIGCVVSLGSAKEGCCTWMSLAERYDKWAVWVFGLGVFHRSGVLSKRGIGVADFGREVWAECQRHTICRLVCFSCFWGGVRRIVKELVYNISLAGWISRLKKGPLAHLDESSYDKQKHPEEENGLIGRLFAFAEMRTGNAGRGFSPRSHGGH